MSSLDSITVVSYQGCNFYLSAKSLTVEDYQCLVDRGWRRSGHTIYKPHMTKSCCPQYSIRLASDTFKTTRDQRQAIHRWNKYVLGEEYIKEAAKKWPLSKEDKKRQKTEFDLVSNIHASEYDTIKDRTPPEPAHRFEVTLEPASFTPEKFAVYKSYQISVHHDDPSEVSERGFRRFLCDSPLKPDESNPKKPLGSYHQIYRLDGKIIALSVLDFLPHTVSGVYFAYLSEYEKWSFGKLSACREASLAGEMGYGYYYMGYYIATCQKMRYKATYGPSEILDPQSNTWTPLTPHLQSLLASHHYYSPTAAASTGNKLLSRSSSSPDDDDDDEEAMHEPGYLEETDMPGLVTDEEIKEKGFVVGNVMLRINQKRGGIVPAGLLTMWEDREWMVRRLVVEVVKAVGLEVAERCVISFC